MMSGEGQESKRSAPNFGFLSEGFSCAQASKDMMYSTQCQQIQKKKKT